MFWTNMESFPLNPLDPDFGVRSEGAIRERKTNPTDYGDRRKTFTRKKCKNLVS